YTRGYKRCCSFFLLLVIALFVIKIDSYVCSIQYEKAVILKPSSIEVMTVTPWLAPVVWTGTFNRDILNSEFEKKKHTIGLTVFALG
ncbi:hypothetical protein NDU88_009250, partial [Pleurodeles waltl]